MELTKGEFSQFSLKSKVKLLRENGLMLMKKKINEMYEIQLFLIYGFYVEVFMNAQKNKILKAEPLLNHNWLDVYLK